MENFPQLVLLRTLESGKNRVVLVVGNLCLSLPFSPERKNISTATKWPPVNAVKPLCCPLARPALRDPFFPQLEELLHLHLPNLPLAEQTLILVIPQIIINASAA